MRVYDGIIITELICMLWDESMIPITVLLVLPLLLDSFHRINEGVQAKYSNGGNALYDLHLICE